MKILSCNSNVPLAKETAKVLNKKIINAEIKKFNDGEINVKINEAVRGHDVFIVQSMSSPVNDNIMELLVTVDALKRASAKQIIAVIPYFGYSRQDRRTEEISPISAKLIADLMTVAGINKVVLVDLHTTQIEGFFNIPIDNLSATDVFIKDIREKYPKDLMIISPDVGGVKRASLFSRKLNADLAVLNKIRPKAGECQMLDIIGDVKGKKCIIVDDMVDSASTLCRAAEAIMENGAKSISAYVTHGIFSGNAIEKIENSTLKEIVITDTIDQKDKLKRSKKIRLLSVTKLLAKEIKEITNIDKI